MNINKFWVLTGGALLLGCVTINVYFPAAAAEKAADRIIEDVWGKGKSAPSTPAGEAPAKPTSQAPELLRKSAHTLARMLVVVSTAEAAADLDISSPAIAEITARMSARHAQLQPHYASGAIGLTAAGDIAMRDPNAVPLAQRNQVKQMVNDDNGDRAALYREIARANGHPEWEAEIRSTFAQRWISRAQGGWHYQDSAGNWQQK